MKILFYVNFLQKKLLHLVKDYVIFHNGVSWTYFKIILSKRTYDGLVAGAIRKTFSFLIYPGFIVN